MNKIDAFRLAMKNYFCDDQLVSFFISIIIEMKKQDKSVAYKIDGDTLVIASSYGNNKEIFRVEKTDEYYITFYGSSYDRTIFDPKNCDEIYKKLRIPINRDDIRRSTIINENDEQLKRKLSIREGSVVKLFDYSTNSEVTYEIVGQSRKTHYIGGTFINGQYSMKSKRVLDKGGNGFDTISTESRLGQELLGKHAGMTVVYDNPSGETEQFKIIEVLKAYEEH